VNADATAITAAQLMLELQRLLQSHPAHREHTATTDVCSRPMSTAILMVVLVAWLTICTLLILSGSNSRVNPVHGHARVTFE